MRELAALVERCRREPGRAAYLALRRGLAAEEELWRRAVPRAAEALFGPPRGDEAPGALGRLDRALDDGDERARRAQLEQVSGALALAGAELSRHPPSPAVRLQALSDAAYAAGARALEALPDSPSQEDAVRADVAGTLDAVERALATMPLAGAPSGSAPSASAPSASAPSASAPSGSAPSASAPSASAPSASAPSASAPSAFAPSAAARAEATTALAALRGQDALTDRARFAVGTGKLGAALRAWARSLGIAVRPPLVAQVASPGAGADDPVSILTVPAPRQPKDEAAASLGRALFFDRRLSRDGDRACADCHRPDHGYSDGLRRPRPLPGTGAIERNTPSLWYAPLQAAQMWDGRVLTPEAQALTVLHAPSEMGLDDAALVRVVASDERLRARFAARFPDGPTGSESAGGATAGSAGGPTGTGSAGGVTAAHIGEALAAFEAAELSPARAPIDRFARGEERAPSGFGPEERAGLDLFAGRARCTRCHLPPLFGGARPPDFSVTVYAALGLPTDPSGRALDGDPGRGRFSPRPHDQGAFKTPSLRNVAATAPYFHHGGFPTLESVLDFYDRGGGRGLGLAVRNQDPDVVPLALTPDEKRLILRFLRRALQDPR